ncbi:CDP-alcohol phosphatidyltransferase family protein, partial [Candidatus Falkowbacteria bacterium]|nr:CDP-alcohol phosphatidyltransferase family protein [Candidatus Falkowbacteria bacterium]
MTSPDQIVFAPYDRLLKPILPLIPDGLKPNHLTFIRLIFSPILIVLLLGEQDLWALSLFIVLAITDMLDGSLARLRNQITDWGKVWDPIADKMLIGSVVVILLLDINLTLMVLLLAFELAFILGGAFHRLVSDARIQANIWGKIKMNLQCFGAGFLILGSFADLSLLT